MIKEHFDKSDRKLNELTEEMRATKQRLAGLEQKAQQLRLAMKADVKLDTNTCKHMEDAAADEAQAWGQLFCEPGRSRPDVSDQLR